MTGSRLVRVLLAFVMAATGFSVVAAAPAHAVTTGWSIGSGPGYTDASGNFVWLNRSVQVGGGITVVGWCSALVFTGYDGQGIQRARATRPKDNEYYCPGGRHGFEFVLDPGNVVGGIQTIRIDLWKRDPATGYVYRAQTRHYGRP